MSHTITENHQVWAPCQNGGGKVQFSQPHDLDLGSGQGHISMYNACRTINMPEPVTVASRSMEIWPFEFREISTFREVWTHVIAFLEGNSKIQAVDYHRSHTIIINHQFWAPRQNGGGDRPRKVQFLELQKLGDLDLGWGRGHTGAHIRLRPAHTPNYIEIRKTFCLRKYVCTDTPDLGKSISSSPGVDLKVEV